MKVIDLLPMLDVGIDKNDCPIKFFRGTEFLATYSEFEVDCEAITVLKLLNSEVELISSDPTNGDIRVFVKE